VLINPRHELYFSSVSDSEHTDCQLDEEFGHIENGALKNKMIINKAKTEELVCHRPHPTKFNMPDPLDGVARQRVAKLLGVIFTGKLSFEDHVNFVLTVCSQRVYLLKLLRSQGLPSSSCTWCL